MITDDELGRFSHPRTLQRARAIAQSDKDILSKRCQYNEGETTLSAFVASSSGWSDRYRTQVTFDAENESIVDYFCSCPAYREYDGLCKHCAALVMAYQSDPHSFMGYRPSRSTATSPAIMAFMQQTGQGVAPDLRRSVDIEITLSYGYRLWSATFAVVAPQARYVIPDISEFVERVQVGATFSYGKKLTFPHVADAFTAHADGVVEVMARAVSQRAEAADGASWRQASRKTIGRSIDLTEAEVIDLLDANGSHGLTIKGGDHSVPRMSRVSVVEEDPAMNIVIEPSRWGGYTIDRPEGVVVVRQGRRSYVWHGETLYHCSADFSAAAGFLKSLCDSDDSHLFVNTQDMPLFCATALPAVESSLNVQLPAEAQKYVPVPLSMEFYLDRTDKGITCQATAVYGSRRYDLFPVAAPDEDPRRLASPTNSAAAARHEARVRLAREKDEAVAEEGPLRDTAQEEVAKALVEHYFDLPIPFIGIEDGEAIGTLLFGGLSHFQAVGEVYTTPAFDRLLSDRKPRYSIGVSLAGNLVDLDIAADDLPLDELSGLLESYRLKKHFHRLKTGAFIDIAELDLSQLDHLATDLGVDATQLAQGQVQLPSFRAFYIDEELGDAEKSAEFAAYVDELRHASVNKIPVPSNLNATLRPYQSEGFHWMSTLCDLGLGGILADEMGLGKSIQLISFLLSRHCEQADTPPSLIVCPASLVYNWTAELARFAPSLQVVAVAGTKQERIAARTLPCDVMVTSYDLLRIDSDAYHQREFFCCVLDEAQFIKNHATLTTRAVKRVRAQHRFALTGTPMENRLSELWSIFDFLMPGFLGSYPRFRETYELDIIGNDEEVAQRLQRMVGPFMLRRLKRDVLKDLPDKLESVVYAPMGKEQQRLYSAREQHIRATLNAQHGRNFKGNKIEMLAELTKLRQICCDPGLLYENYRGGSTKLDTITELVQQATDEGSKVLVFSQFTTFLDRIADRMDAAGLSHYVITGATRKQRRVELVDAFNVDDTPVFLISLKAGGTGLNLTGASVVIHADPWWNAAAQDQATDRAHRIGQKNVVSVQKVIAKGTIEERILSLQEAKSALADQVISGSGVSLSSLSRDDLLSLLEDSL